MKTPMNPKKKKTPRKRQIQVASNLNPLALDTTTFTDLQEKRKTLKQKIQKRRHINHQTHRESCPAS